MAFTVPPLPYAFDALEPYIDAKTMEIHHDKHHGAYVTNLNKALESAPDLQSKTVEELLANNCAIVPENIKTAVRNNGGGHINHSMFWTDSGAQRRRQPVRQRRERDQFHVRQLRHVQGKIRRRGHQALRLRLGLAGQGQQGGRDYFHRQSGQPGDGGPLPGDGPGCLGARLLSEVSEPAARIYRRVVERGELAGD